MKTGSTTAARHPLMLTVLLAFLLLGAGIALAQDGDIIEFKGQSSTVTPVFEVEAPWILDWRIFSDFPQSLSVEMALLDAKTGLHEGLIVQTKEMGTGVKLFREGGSYKVRVDSDLVRWQILVKELTEEEAEQYTPRSENSPANEWFRTRSDD